MNPETRIVEERRDLLIIHDRNGISTIPRTDYYILRIRHYGCNRILYDFGTCDAVVKETYDEGIFNCWLAGRQMQIADGAGIASAILNRDVDGYRRIFQSWFETACQSELIESVVASHPARIRHEGDAYVIDEMFNVDAHGVAHSLDRGNWKHLCIVAAGVGECIMDMPGMGPVRMNPVTQTIIAKIIFLLYPNAGDRVFTDQLSEECRTHVARTASRAGARE